MGNGEGGSIEQEKIVMPIEAQELKAETLDQMSIIINNRKIDLSNPSHKDFIKRFLKQISIKNSDEALQLNDISSSLTSEGGAFRKVLALVKSYEKKKVEEKTFGNFTEGELGLLKDFMEGKTTERDRVKAELKYLYEGTKFNNIDINSAINAIKKGLSPDGDKVSPEFVSFLKQVREYSSMLNATGDEESKKKNYESSIIRPLRSNEGTAQEKSEKLYKFTSTWNDGEIRDLVAFMREQFGDDYDSIVNNGTINEKSKKAILKKFSIIDIPDSEYTKELNVNDMESLLGYIADFGGVDQGEKPDGVLRAKNSKHYTGFLNRIFTNGEWAQSEVVGELQVYNGLKSKIKSVPELKSLIVQSLYSNDINGGTAEVNRIFSSDNQDEIKELLRKFQQVGLGKVSQLKDPKAFTANNEEFSKDVVRQAGEKVKEIKILQEEVSKTKGFKDKFKELIGVGATQEDAKKILDTMSFTMLSNLELTAGLSVTSLTEKTIHKVVNHLGELLSKTETKKTSVSGKPYLVLSFDIASFKERFGDAGKVTLEGGVGATGALGIDGLAIPINGVLRPGVTVYDSIKGIQDVKSSGSYRIVGSGTLGYDIINNGDIASVGVNLQFNDQLNKVEQEMFKQKRLLTNLIDKNGNLKETGIADTTKLVDDMLKNMGENTFEQKLYLNVLKVNLVHLESAINQVNSIEDKTVDKEKLKTTILNTWLKSVISDFEMNIHNANSGISLAGLHIGYIFGVNLLNVGLNFNNIGGDNSDPGEEKTRKYKSMQEGSLIQSGAEKSKQSILDKYVKVKEDGRKLVVDASVDIVIDDSSKDTIKIEEKADGRKILKSDSKIFAVPTKMDRDDISAATTIRFSNTDMTESRGSNVEVKIDGQAKIGKLTESKTDISKLLPGLNFDKFGKRIENGIRGKIEGKEKAFRDIFDLVENFLNEPNSTNEELLRNKLSSLDGLFQGRNKEIKSFNTEQLRALAILMMKYGWRDRLITGQGDGSKIFLTEKQHKSHIEEVYNKEQKLFSGIDSTAVQEILKAKKQVVDGLSLKPMDLTRQSLSGLLGSSLSNYSQVLSMVTSTPKGGKPRLTTIAGIDTEVYGTPVDIEGDVAKLKILDQFKTYLEAHLKEINSKLPNGVKIDFEQYKNMILGKSVNINSKEGYPITLKVNGSSFKSFNVGFAGNECLNAGAGLLLGKLSYAIEVPGKGTVDFVETGGINEPNLMRQQTTLALGFQQIDRETVTQTVEKLPEPKKPETGNENEDTGIETEDTGTETEETGTETEETGTETEETGTETEETGTETEETGTESIPGDTGSETGTENEDTGSENEGTGSEAPTER